jgi:hypothetical protein
VTADPVAKHLRTIIDAHGDAWGYQYRHNFGDLVSVEIPSLLGRFMAEGFAATDGQNKPRSYPEVFMGMGLTFSRAIKGANERDREMAFAHYVSHAHVTRKASALHIERSTYYQRLDTMRANLAPALLGSVDESIWTNEALEA